MKKQYTYIAAVCAIVLGFGAVAHAQGTAATSAAMTKKARLQEAVMNMERSLAVRITGLDALASRIQTRIGKMQAAGGDMTAASAKLVEAQKQIADAKTALESLQKADAAMVASARPATAFGAIKNKLVKNVAVKIKAAHKALVDTIVLMKGQGAATSTAY